MDIRERLAAVRFLSVRADVSHLSVDELAALRSCVDAANLMTDIYLDQVWVGNRAMLKRLRADADPDVLRYYMIHGSPWDEFNNDEPFIDGVGPKPKFGSFYPPDFTKERFNQWLSEHPEDREAFTSPYTVLRERAEGLFASGYHHTYGDRLREAGMHLWQAAQHLPAGKLSTFLRSRSDAFRTNNYFPSELDWVDTDGQPFEVTIGPYEVYFDGLLGLKASFEAFIGLPDRDATAALTKFTPAVPEFDGILSQEFNFKPKGSAIPLEVVADVVRGGEAAFGYLFVAYNLPNDRRVHELKGSKKVFSRTMMQAKFDYLARPIAERVLGPAEAARATFDKRLLFVLGHELAHGLGPAFVQRNGQLVPFETLLGDQHSCIEEAKADMLGARLLGYFRTRGLLDDETLSACLVSEVGAWFSSWRHGFGEAHARGHLVQYNWLRERGAVAHDRSAGVVRMDPEKALAAMVDLSTEFMRLQSDGDYSQAKAFMEHWTTVPSEVPEVLERLADLPKAVIPVYDTDF